MSELKYQLMLNKDMSLVPCYLKSEADKVIADLEESHKMEVEQLLMEIVELKRQIEFLKVTHGSCGDCNKCAEGMGKVFDETLNELKAQKEQACDDLIHQKYKRCLDKANYWVAVSYQCIDDKHRKKAEKRHYKWLELAEKFKEAK